MTAGRRTVAFDPTDRELFVEQQQRLDWRLLQNGFVHRYEDRFALDTTSGQLSDQGYLVHSIDTRAWNDADDMHTALATALAFPDYYGRNIDALNDVLHDVAQYQYGSDSKSAGTVLALATFDAFLAADRRTAVQLLDVFARRAGLAALYGHRMLCLIESVDDQIGRVGGNAVVRQAVSEFPPDASSPFDESTIVVISFQIYATPAEAEACAAAIGTAVAPVLDSVGSWEMRPPQRVPARNGGAAARHPSSGRLRAPGDELFDVDLAVRGRGDRSLLGDAVLRAVQSAHLRFERMTETSFTGRDRVAVMDAYPRLR